MTSSVRLSAAPIALRVLSLACSVVLAGPAVAADNAKKPAASPGDRVMTPAQLKACIDQRDAMRAKVDDVKKDKAGIDAEKAEVERNEKTLADALAGIDRTKQEDIDGYNEKVRAHQQKVEAFQQHATAYNAKAEAARGVQDDYAKACENRRYDDRDLADIQRGKKP